MSKHTRDGVGSGVGDLLPDLITPVGANKTSDGTLQPLQLDDSGNLKVTSSGGGGGGAVTIADGADVAEGSTGDAAWSGSGAGTVVSILKKMASSGTGGGPATIADGADVAEGATTDAAVTTDVNSTISGKLRGLVKIFGDVWDSVNHRLKVDGSGVTQPISVASLPLPSNAAQETGGNLAAIVTDLADQQTAPFTYTSGVGGPTVIATPGKGTLLIWISGTWTGNVAFEEQFTTGGSYTGVGGYVVGAPSVNNVAQNYQAFSSQTGVISNSFVVVINCHGINVRLTNNVSSGTATLSAVYKRGEYFARPSQLQGAGNNYAMDVNQFNEGTVTRVGTNTQWVIGTGNDGVANRTDRSQPFDASVDYLFNGTTWDRPRGDTTNGAWVNVKNSVLPSNAAKESGGNLELARLDLDSIAAAITSAAAPPSGTNGFVTYANIGVPSPYTPTGGGTDFIGSLPYTRTWSQFYGGRIAFSVSAFSGANVVLSFQLRLSGNLSGAMARRLDTGEVASSFTLTGSTSTIILIENPSANCDFIVNATGTIGGGVTYQIYADGYGTSTSPQTIRNTVTTSPQVSGSNVSITNPVPVIISDGLAPASGGDFAQLQLLTQMLAELKAIHIQLADLGGRYVETASLFETNIIN